MFTGGFAVNIVDGESEFRVYTMKHLQTIIEDHSTAERICACCGMVLGKTIPSDRGVTTQDNESKIHWNSTTSSHHDGAMGSVANMSSKKSFKINVWQSRLRIQDSKDARIYANFKTLEKIFDSRQVPKSIQNIAYHLSKKSTKRLLDTNAKKDSFQKAIIFFAYEISQNKYLRRQFITDFGVTNKNLFNKYFWLLKQEFHVTTDYTQFTEKLLYRHAIDMKFSKKEIELAQCIINHARKKGLTSSKDPIVLVGTALYISHYSLHRYEPDTLHMIAKNCNIHPETIQKIKRQWHEILDMLNLRRSVCKYAKTKYI